MLQKMGAHVVNLKLVTIAAVDWRDQPFILDVMLTFYEVFIVIFNIETGHSAHHFHSNIGHPSKINCISIFQHIAQCLVCMCDISACSRYFLHAASNSASILSCSVFQVLTTL